MGRIGRVRVDNDNILEVVEISRLLFVDGCGRFEQDFNVGGEAFLGLIRDWRGEKRRAREMGEKYRQ